MKHHSYIPRKARIVERKLLCEDIVGLRLKSVDRKPFSFHPGQFLMLSVAGFGEVPIGITTSPKEKDHLEVAVRSVGLVTNKIFDLKEKDQVGLNGPFGNGFPLPEIKGKDLVLMAGGLGLAPLRSLIRHIGTTPQLVKSLMILNGARSPEQLLYGDEYQEWRKFADVNLTVDECGPDWGGCVGNITELFDKVKVPRGAVIITCGPPVMFDSIIKRYAGKTVAEKDLYFLLERKMKCGIGKCQHCTCGEYYVCLDGPVFAYDKIKYNKEAFS